jgi:hypothetical protein
LHPEFPIRNIITLKLPTLTAPFRFMQILMQEVFLDLFAKYGYSYHIMEKTIQISSFSAPTDDDMVAWNRLSPEQQRTLARRQLLTEPPSPPERLDAMRRYTIFAHALNAAS